MTHLPKELRATEIELCYRNKIKASERPKVKTSQDAYQILIASWNVNRMDLAEDFKVLLLDRGNTVLGVSTIGSGGVSACLVDPKLIFATALKAKSSGIILCHNHPSGNLAPSSNDFDLTKKLMRGGQLLEIAILDHLIITSEGYLSMADEGIMPSLS